MNADPTLLPPPKYTKERADFIYGEAFRRAMEFVAYQPQPEPIGDVLEFGTLNGYTARKLAELMAELGHPGRLVLFDSFEGMPEARDPVDLASYEIRAGAWAPGTPAVRIPGVEVIIKKQIDCLLPGRVSIVKGWFCDTVKFLQEIDPPSIVHVDCDLYESTVTVLRALVAHQKNRDGMVLLVDDWNNSRGNEHQGERRAIREIFPTAEKWFSYGWSGEALIYHA